MPWNTSQYHGVGSLHKESFHFVPCFVFLVSLHFLNVFSVTALVELDRAAGGSRILIYVVNDCLVGVVDKKDRYLMRMRI